MNALAHLSDIVIPILIFFIVGYGVVSGVKVYETFLKGINLSLSCDNTITQQTKLSYIGFILCAGYHVSISK